MLYIHAEGLLKFNNYIKEMVGSYGHICDLWHKQKALEKWANRIDMGWTSNLRISKTYLIPLLKSEIEKSPIKVSEFAKKYNLSYIRAYKLFFRLKQRRLIKKIGIGIFSSVNHKGPLIESLADKIKRKLSTEAISVKEFSRHLNANPKSVSTQLSIFTRKGIVIRIQRGCYALV